MYIDVPKYGTGVEKAIDISDGDGDTTMGRYWW